MRLLGLRGHGLFPLVTAVAVLIGAGNGLLGVCGPLLDVADDAFCPLVLEIFYLGITTGTTPTTYDPTSNVSRLQMAAFLSRTVDRVLRRGSRRAALDQLWTSQNATVLGVTTVGLNPGSVRSDGADLWVANFNGGSVSRVRASDGKMLETWTGATSNSQLRVAMGRVFITGQPSSLYMIDPTQTAGAVSTVATNLGNGSGGIAFDGSRIWTANSGFALAGSVSIVTPGTSIPWTVTTVTTGFTHPANALFDGASVWVTDNGAPGGTGSLRKLDSNGAILQTITIGTQQARPVFDGANIWIPFVPISDPPPVGRISVVRASSGAILATLTGNGMFGPYEAAFDGERILATNPSGDSVSLWKAADLTPLGSFSMGAGTTPVGACSDGVNFWITLQNANKLARF